MTIHHAIMSINYDKLPIKVVQKIEIRDAVGDFVRKAGYSILCFLGKLVDGLENIVDDLLSLNLYSIITNVIDVDGFVTPLVVSIFSLALVISAIMLIKNHEKIKISEYLSNVICTMLLILALPMLFSAGEDLIQVAKKDIWGGISTGSAVETNLGIGEQIISNSIMAIHYSADGNIRHYDDTAEFANGLSPYYLNINICIDNESWDKYPTSIVDEGIPYRKVDSLTYLDKFAMLGLDTSLYHKLYKGGVTIPVGTAVGIDSWGNPIYNTRYFTEDQFIRYVIGQIASSPRVQAANLTYQVSTQKSVEAALDQCAPIISQLNAKYNDTVKSNSSDIAVVGQYKWAELKTAEDYNELGDISRLIENIKTFGYPVEEVYAYAFDFLDTLIILLAMLLSLAFVCIKISKQLYELVFIQVLAPLALATDTQGAGRAKKVIQEIINAYLMFVIILFALKIYLIMLFYSLDNIDNIILQLLLVIGGGMFVIGGSEFVTKIVGVDTGAKMGYGGMVAAQTAGGLALGALSTAKNSPKSVASKVGSMVGKHDAKKDGVGFISRTAIGQAFNNARAQQHAAFDTAPHHPRAEQNNDAANSQPADNTQEAPPPNN